VTATRTPSYISDKAVAGVIVIAFGVITGEMKVVLSSDPIVVSPFTSETVPIISTEEPTFTAVVLLTKTPPQAALASWI